MLFVSTNPLAKPFMIGCTSGAASSRVAGAMKAYVAVQKRLLLMAYALWRHEVDHDPEYLANRASKDKKIVPTGGTTQDQLTVAELSYL